MTFKKLEFILYIFFLVIRNKFIITLFLSYNGLYYSIVFKLVGDRIERVCSDCACEASDLSSSLAQWKNLTAYTQFLPPTYIKHINKKYHYKGYDWMNTSIGGKINK